jgi:hypothetical protein
MVIQREIAREFAALEPGEPGASAPRAQQNLPHLIMPSHHDVRGNDVIPRPRSRGK